MLHVTPGLGKALFLSFLFVLGLIVPISAQISPISQDQRPELQDDLDQQGLETVLGQNLRYLQRRPADSQLMIGGQPFPVQRLINSTNFLLKLLQEGRGTDALLEQLSSHYEFFRLDEGKTAKASPRRMLITGYYQPLFAGSLVRTPQYRYPVYKQPTDLVVRPGKPGQRKALVGRMQADQFTPYWSRREIEQGNLLKGQELVWLADPFDTFVLHVQGSGIIRLPDGSQKGVHYAQSNGREYRSVGKYLVETGRMQLADVTMDSIRQYVARHPEERELILHQNDSYIFFEWSKAGPAIGNLGFALTPGRSIAADQQWYPPGALVYIESRKPLVTNGQITGWASMRRLVCIQDTGSGLVGPNRADVFWGTGDAAGLAAGQMKEEGRLYLLLLRE